MFVQAGQRIGRGVVVNPEIRVQPQNRRGALLRCDCGKFYEAPLLSLVERNGVINTTSCGCAKADHIRSVAWRGGHKPGQGKKHGLSGHPLYMSWKQMLRRCERPENHNYHRYGGRGIKVCPQWHDLATFVREVEAEIGPRPKGFTLDRIENDGNYEPGNIRWATHSEQAMNQCRVVRELSCFCGFTMKLVYQLISWWQCPQCGRHHR